MLVHYVIVKKKMLFYNLSLILTFHIFFVCKVCVARYVLKTPQRQSGGQRLNYEFI